MSRVWAALAVSPMPALIAGNGVVLKPDNKSTLCVAECVRLLYEAGLPRGLFQIVCGDGPDVGPALIDDADFVMFTGSTATGRFVGARAGENLIDCTLELGGKNPLIVLEDADLDDTVAGAAFGTFLNAGQACMGASHLMFAIASTGYIALGIRYEERDLRRTFGTSYEEYARRVPSLIPAPQRHRTSRTHQETT